MAKKSAKAAASESGSSNHGITSQPAISKAEAVRQALSAGMDRPADGVEFIKAHYGIEIENQTFSTYKAQQKARAAKKEVAKPKAAVEGYLAPPKIEAAGDGDLLGAMEAMKPLVASLGADKVKRIVDLLG